MTEGWQRTGPHCLERGPWILGKYLVCGKPRYAIWRGNENKGYYDTAAEAMDEADRQDSAAANT